MKAKIRPITRHSVMGSWNSTSPTTTVITTLSNDQIVPTTDSMLCLVIAGNQAIVDSTLARQLRKANLYRRVFANFLDMISPHAKQHMERPSQRNTTRFMGYDTVQSHHP